MNATTETRKNGVHDDSTHMNVGQVLRDKFADTLHQLDDLRDSITKLERTARANPVTFIAASSAVLIAVAGGITMGILENKRRSSFAYKFMKSMKWAKALL